MLFQYAAVAAADAVEKLVGWPAAAAVAVVVVFAVAPGAAVAWFAVVRLVVAAAAAAVGVVVAAVAVVVAAAAGFAAPVAAAVIGVVAEHVAELVAVAVAVDVVGLAELAAFVPRGNSEPSHPISSQLYHLAHQKLVDPAATYARNPRPDVEHVRCTVHFVALRAVAEYVAGACVFQRL